MLPGQYDIPSTIKPLILTIGFVAALLFTAPSSIALQYDQYVERQQNLVALAGVFGELHHIRRTCEPRLEANIWRRRMQTLVELEEPSNQVHVDMVNAFNKGFQTARTRFPQCSQSAQEIGKDRAFRGKEIVKRLTTPLQKPALQIIEQ